MLQRVMSKIVSLSGTKQDLNEIVNYTATVLRGGGVIATPTDTVYGVASLCVNVDKLYDLKERNCRKPVAICVGNISDCYRYAKVLVPKELLTELLPGPVTLVFERSELLPQCVNPTANTVGIRIPDSDFIVSLAQRLGEPLALTSANVSSTQSTLEPSEFKSLWPKLDLIIDAGRLTDDEKSRQGSTVVDLSRPHSFEILRSGSALKRTKEILSHPAYGLQEYVDLKICPAY